MPRPSPWSGPDDYYCGSQYLVRLCGQNHSRQHPCTPKTVQVGAFFPAHFLPSNLESQIAIQHNGSRAVATGYNASAEYVEEVLSTYDTLTVHRQYFLAPVWTGMGSQLGITQPFAVNYTDGIDYYAVRYGGVGEFQVESTSSTYSAEALYPVATARLPLC